MRVLAGDIGGTKVLLEIAEVDGGHVRMLHERRYFSEAYDALEPIVREFLQTLPAGLPPGIDAACFGVAGPVIASGTGQHASLTNLPWVVDSEALGRELGVAKVRLINDFQAAGYGIEGLQENDYVVLQAAVPRAHAPRIVIGAGTGLGQGILFWEHDHYEVLATEGGHVDFAPTDELEVELWRYLRRQFDRVSYERVLSGPGLVHIYTFLREYGDAPESAEIAQAMDAGDPAAVIGEAGAEGRDALAEKAVDLFVRIYGAQTGNLALATLPVGGIYVAGGIAPKIIKKMSGGAFLAAFGDKGRMRELLARMPVSVVMNSKVGLVGAALAAGRL